MTKLIAAHPRRSLVLVLLFVVIAGMFGGPVAGQLDSGPAFTADSSESSRGERQIERAAGTTGPDALLVLVRGDADPATVAREMRGIDGIAAVQPPTRSEDGRSSLVAASLYADADEDAVGQATIDRFADTRGVTVGGSALIGDQIGGTVSQDLARAELFALPLLALLSLLFFRGRATLLPVIVGLTTVLGTFLVLMGVNQLYSLSVFALNLVIGLGLGLAIDYSLFAVTRFREELARGAEVPEAVSTTMRTAGRTIAFSAVTVAAALATLTVFDLGFAQSMGIAGATVALVAAAVTLVICPALLTLWGRKVLRRADTKQGGEGRWYRFSHAVMGRPGLIAFTTAAVMIAISMSAINVKWTPVDNSVIPKDQSARVVADAIERDFGGVGGTPVTVAVTAAANQRAQVEAFAERVEGIKGVEAASARPTGDNTWTVDATVAGDPADDRAQDVVKSIRALNPPLATAVTGPAAAFVDQQAEIAGTLPYAIALLCLLTFLVLWLMTGSVVLPIKAIIMNALTVGAALAPLVWIYQNGHLENVLGYTSNGGVEPTDFLVTAALVFALSTDYGVFLLGRIKEQRDNGATEREAVATGLARTGSVVTAAAILLAVAIGAFSTSSISFIQQIGIATATGVLLDAFVVRALLVPSLMALLGKWNWWSPRPLRLLHRKVGLAEG